MFPYMHIMHFGHIHPSKKQFEQMFLDSIIRNGDMAQVIEHLLGKYKALYCQNGWMERYIDR
jgi:galactose-1-phosphate uridylyltransferase